MQIWKTPYMFLFNIKAMLENFAFLIIRILELFAREVCKFLEHWADFKHILWFLNVCKQTFHISHSRISQEVKGVLMWNFQHIISIWRRIYWQIFRSALVLPLISCFAISFSMMVFYFKLIHDGKFVQNKAFVSLVYSRFWGQEAKPQLFLWKKT